VNRRFNFSQCVTLLDTNFKTFKRWLTEDGIDAEQQQNRADSREKYLTEDQLVAMARKREIPLQLPEERKGESTSAKILAGLAGMDSRITTLEQQITGRFDQVDTQLAQLQTLAEIQHQMEQLMAEVQRLRTSTPPQERPPVPAPQASNAAPAISTSTPRTTTTPPPLTRPARRKRKAKARKLLPATLTPLASFRQAHGISEKAVEIAIQKNRLAVKRGAWVHEHRSIGLALDRQGQQQFHELFSEHAGFERSDDCPMCALSAG